MGFIQKIQAFPQLLSGMMFAFLAILMIRVTYPFANAVLALWTETTTMKVVAILVFYLVIFFVLYIMVWIKFFQPTEGGDN